MTAEDKLIIKVVLFVLIAGPICLYRLFKKNSENNIFNDKEKMQLLMSELNEMKGAGSSYKEMSNKLKLMGYNKEISEKILALSESV